MENYGCIILLMNEMTRASAMLRTLFLFEKMLIFNPDKRKILVKNTLE